MLVCPVLGGMRGMLHKRKNRRMGARGYFLSLSVRLQFPSPLVLYSPQLAIH